MAIRLSDTVRNTAVMAIYYPVATVIGNNINLFVLVRVIHFIVFFVKKGFTWVKAMLCYFFGWLKSISNMRQPLQGMVENHSQQQLPLVQPGSVNNDIDSNNENSSHAAGSSYNSDISMLLLDSVIEAEAVAQLNNINNYRDLDYGNSAKQNSFDFDNNNNNQHIKMSDFDRKCVLKLMQQYSELENGSVVAKFSLRNAEKQFACHSKKSFCG